MRWFRIPKDNSPKPDKGKHYWDWKEYLSKEGNEQCVYCSLNINTFGGLRNFHVEHYKPKSLYRDLEHNISNLFFACSICNCFKSDDWPNDPLDDFSNFSFPDPSKVDYSNLLYQNNNFIIESNYVTGKYIIEKLYLNRPQLILARKNFFLHQQLLREYLEVERLLNLIEEKEGFDCQLARIFKKALKPIEILIQGQTVNPYTESQIQR